MPRQFTFTPFFTVKLEDDGTMTGSFDWSDSALGEYFTDDHDHHPTPLNAVVCVVLDKMESVPREIKIPSLPDESFVIVDSDGEDYSGRVFSTEEDARAEVKRMRKLFPSDPSLDVKRVSISDIKGG